ncbi:hypothetical protein C7G69_09360, partial [Acinetobacter baumannii]
MSSVHDKFHRTLILSVIDEVNLTPKPALVDRRGSGAHNDLTLEL